MRVAKVCLAAFTAVMLSWTANAQVVPLPSLAYDLAPGEIAHLGHASVRLFADGRAQIRRPVYWRDAGTYERRLPLDQVNEILQLALGLTLSELSSESLAKARTQTEPAATVFEVHDADRVTLTIRQLGVEQTIQVAAPAAQQARLPNLPALAALVDLDMRLRGLLDELDDPSLRRIADEELAP